LKSQFNNSKGHKAIFLHNKLVVATIDSNTTITERSVPFPPKFRPQNW